MLVNPSPDITRIQQRLSSWIAKRVPLLKRRAQKILPPVSAFLRWQRAVLLGPVWLSFEGYLSFWQALMRFVDPNGDPSRPGRTRAIYCLVLSLTVWQFAFLSLTQLRTSIVSIVISALHGLIVQIFWERGRRWCRRQLGLRPMRSVDPSRPFDGLDLGN